MYDSERLIRAIGEIEEEKIEKTGRALGYMNGPADAARPHIRAGKLLMVAAVAALILSLGITAYAVYSQWSKGLEQSFHPTEEEKTYAETSRLWSEPEQENTGEGMISATAGGVTVTVQQAIADNYSARISLRIEGYALPEGEYPDIGGFSVTVAGETVPAASGGFTQEYNEAGTLQFCGEDGTMEYVLALEGKREPKFFDGKEIRIIIMGLGTGDKGMYIPAVDESWELAWTLKASNEIRTLKPGLEIGDTGVILEEVELSPISLRVLYRTQDLWEEYKTLERYDLQPVGVRLRDGTVYQKIFWGGLGTYIDLDARLLEIQDSSERILKTDDVEALLFACSGSVGQGTADNECYAVPLAD